MFNINAFEPLTHSTTMAWAIHPENGLPRLYDIRVYKDRTVWIDLGGGYCTHIQVNEKGECIDHDGYYLVSACEANRAKVQALITARQEKIDRERVQSTRLRAIIEAIKNMDPSDSRLDRIERLL